MTNATAAQAVAAARRWRRRHRRRVREPCAGTETGLTQRDCRARRPPRCGIVPDPTFDCTDVTGKVFDDVNRNKLQDSGEKGLAGARGNDATGLTATTDAYGRFHITCAVTPARVAAATSCSKLDNRTLPSGYRPSTEQTVRERATRGKALKFNFGASIHASLLDVADAVFQPGTTEMRRQWQPRMSLLLRRTAEGHRPRCAPSRRRRGRRPGGATRAGAAQTDHRNRGRHWTAATSSRSSLKFSGASALHQSNPPLRELPGR